MKSRLNVKYIEMPLSVFAVNYSTQYFDMVSKRVIPVDAVFDNRYIVRMKCDGSGGAIEIGFASDEWIISDQEENKYEH